MESVVEVFIEKAGAPICAKMGQENASKLHFPRIERPSQEWETPQQHTASWPPLKAEGETRASDVSPDGRTKKR
jgi:hypothetical protein